MTTLVLSTDPAWLKHWADRGATVCTTTEAALAYLESGSYDRLIVDAGMVEQLGRVRVPVVAVTNQETVDEARRCYRAGAGEYRVKDWGMM